MTNNKTTGMILCCSTAHDGQRHADGCPLADTTHSVSYRGFEVRRMSLGDYPIYENGKCIGVGRSVAQVRSFIDTMVRCDNGEVA